MCLYFSICLLVFMRVDWWGRVVVIAEDFPAVDVRR